MSTDHLRIPAERVDQLRALADFKGLTMSDLIGDLVTDEINRLDLFEKIGLGRQIEVCLLEDDSVMFSAANIGTFNWSKPVAASLGGSLKLYATKGGATLDMDAGLELRRVGTSVTVRNIVTKEHRALAPTVARDLGDWLIKVAA